MKEKLKLVLDRILSIDYSGKLKAVAPFAVEVAGGSKKLAAFVRASVVIILVHLGLPLTDYASSKVSEQVMMITMTYLAAQGLADVGKEKVKLEKEVE
jgi:hypothetical protein